MSDDTMGESQSTCSVRGEPSTADTKLRKIRQLAWDGAKQRCPATEAEGSKDDAVGAPESRQVHRQVRHTKLKLVRCCSTKKHKIVLWWEVQCRHGVQCINREQRGCFFEHEVSPARREVVFPVEADPLRTGVFHASAAEAKAACKGYVSEWESEEESAPLKKKAATMAVASSEAP